MTAASLAPVFTNIDAERTQRLEQISAAACENGQAIVLNFSAIRDRLGQRWFFRREDIWTHVERTMAKQLSPGTLYFRLDQTEYLVCFAEERNFSAHAIGFRIIEQILTHFLGRCVPEDMHIQTITSIAGDQIVGTEVVFTQEHLGEQPPSAGQSSREQRVRSTPSLTASIDDQLNLICSVESVLNIKNNAEVGMRIAASFYDVDQQRSVLVDGQTKLPTRSLLSAGVHVLNTFEWVTREYADTQAFIVPLPLQMFGNSHSRFTIFGLLNKIAPEDRRRLVIELSGLERGTPDSRIVETVALLKPFCRSVMARAPLCRSAIVNTRVARLSGMIVNAADIGVHEARLAAGLLAFGEAAKGIAPVLMATSLPSRVFDSVCAVAGFTHMTVKAS